MKKLTEDQIRDNLDKVLKSRIDARDVLAAGYLSLIDAQAQYDQTFADAVKAGWTRKELQAAGLPAPASTPRKAKSRPTTVEEHSHEGNF